MQVKTTERERRRFFERSEAGESYTEIAESYGVSRGCVRYWCRRQRKEGNVSTKSTVRKSQGLLSHFDPLVRYGILRLRLRHLRWGPNRIRYHLRKRSSTANKRLPSERQISRYLKQWPRLGRPRQERRVQRERPHLATRVHQRWQLDFKLGIPLQDGTLVNLHTVHDPVGGVCITATVTPAGVVGEKGRHVTIDEVQVTLRSGFTRWQTLPEEVQTDGEALFVGNPVEHFPSRFTLWLMGLGIQHLVEQQPQAHDVAGSSSVCSITLWQ